MRARIPITGILLLLLATPLTVASPAAAATTPAEEWRQSLPGTTGVMLDLGPNDDVFAVGYTLSKVVTRRYSPAGALQWERMYPAAGNTHASWISAHPAGGAVVSAYNVSGSSFSPAGWVTIRYDDAGTALWTNVIPVGVGRTVRVEIDAAGNSYVTGTMFLTGPGDSGTVDAVTIKYASNGTKLWERAFNGEEFAADEPRSIAVSADGTRVAVTGRTGTSFFAVVYDAQGNELGRRVDFDLGPGTDVASGPANVFYAGSSSWTQQTDDQMVVVKLNASGGLIWERSYADGDFSRRIAVAPNGDVVVAGEVGDYFNWVTLRIDANGNPLWSRIYDEMPSPDERPFFLTIDPFGAAYVTGAGGPPPGGPGISLVNAATAKYAADGTREWVVLPTTGNGVGVRIGSDQAVYVQAEREMLTAKYSQDGEPPPPGEAPPAPTGLTVAGTTRARVNLRWTNQSADQDSVLIERCRGVGCTSFAQVAQVDGTATAFADRRLSSNTTYRYRVRAMNEAGTSPYSNVVSATTN
jgi:hypothetical protein